MFLLLGLQRVDKFPCMKCSVKFSGRLSTYHSGLGMGLAGVWLVTKQILSLQHSELALDRSPRAERQDLTLALPATSRMPI